MTHAFYNDIDPKACAWLQELIAGGHIAPGVVDNRSITDIRPDELRDFTQVHFFAGIGGWSLALRWAGWPDERRVWTGSCPCQPLSCAGQRKGHADQRHLWPSFHDLIAECKPSVVFGEQVASADGREWFAGVRLDLEDLGYACGGADLCAAGVGAPHRRQRLFWVADASLQRCERRLRGRKDSERQNQHGRIGCSSSTGELANATGGQRKQCLRTQGNDIQRPSDNSAVGWSRFETVHCRDGKTRRFEPGSFPLAHGLPGRVGLLRGYGNAIVPQVAAEFIQAFVETLK